MSLTEQNRFAKKRFVPSVIYTAVLCLSAQLYIFLSKYDLFMQVLDTLLPLFALVSLLVLSIVCALLLIARTPLWLLFPCHMLIACWWLLSFYLQAPADQRTVSILWDGYNLGFFVTCLLPPLLGWGLLTYRWRRLQKARAAQEATAPELSFESATEILNNTDAAHHTDSKATHE